MTVKIFFTSILLFYALQLGADNLDSLKNVLPNLKGKERVVVLDKITSLMLPTSDSSYAIEAIQLAQSLNIPEIEASSLLSKALINVYIYNYDQAVVDYKNLIQHSTKNKLTEYELQAYTNLIDVYRYKQDYTSAFSEIQNYMARAKEYGDESLIGDGYFSLGTLYGSINVYDKANEALDKAYYYYKKSNNEVDLCLQEKGLILSLMNERDSAEYYFLKALDVIPADATDAYKTYFYALIYYNLAENAFDDQQYEKAEKYALLSLQVDNTDTYNLAFNNSLLALIYTNQFNRVQEAKKLMAGMLEIAEEYEDYHLYSIVYEALRDIAKKENNTIAWEYNEMFNNYEDSIYNADKEYQLLGIEAQYKVKQQKQEVELLKQKAKTQTAIQLSGIIIGGLAILTMIILYNQLKLRNKNQLQKIALLEANKQKRQLELKELKAKQQVEHIENERLKEKVDYTSRSLASNTTYLVQKNEMLTNIKSKIEKIATTNINGTKKELTSIIKQIESSMNMDADWDTFQLHFENVHPTFFDDIIAKHDKLNNNELRLCAYIKMGLSNKEIARLLNINSQSVIVSRYRLKKKLNLDKDQNINDYILNI